MVKNLNITGLHWKIFSLGEDQLLKKGGLGQFADFGGLGKKEGVVILKEGVDTPMHTIVYLNQYRKLTFL